MLLTFFCTVCVEALSVEGCVSCSGVEKGTKIVGLQQQQRPAGSEHKTPLLLLQDIIDTEQSISKYGEALFLLSCSFCRRLYVLMCKAEMVTGPLEGFNWNHQWHISSKRIKNKFILYALE